MHLLNISIQPCCVAAAAGASRKGVQYAGTCKHAGAWCESMQLQTTTYKGSSQPLQQFVQDTAVTSPQGTHQRCDEGATSCER